MKVDFFGIRVKAFVLALLVMFFLIGACRHLWLHFR